MSQDGLGHNSAGLKLRVEVRLFNSLSKYNGVAGICRQIELDAGSTGGDVMKSIRLPVPEIFFVLRNGWAITPGLYQGGVINEDVALDDGDVIAFSGPVPYSYGYGAPVV